jgi:hypothetical protein
MFQSFLSCFIWGSASFWHLLLMTVLNIT